MDTFFILVLLIFVAPAVLRALKTAKQSAKPKPSPRTRNSNQNSNPPWNSPEFRDLKQTLQEMSGAKTSGSSSRGNRNQQAQRKTEYEARQRRSKVDAAKRARRLKAHDASHGDTVERRDIHDKNRNRRADWGARVGPGVLNTKTFITAIVIGGVLAILMAQS